MKQNFKNVTYYKIDNFDFLIITSNTQNLSRTYFKISKYNNSLRIKYFPINFFISKDLIKVEQISKFSSDLFCYILLMIIFDFLTQRGFGHKHI